MTATLFSHTSLEGHAFPPPSAKVPVCEIFGENRSLRGNNLYLAWTFVDNAKSISTLAYMRTNAIQYIRQQTGRAWRFFVSNLDRFATFCVATSKPSPE